MFGTIFKEKRQSLGVSLDDVSSELKIRKRYLEAIENDNHAELQSGFYFKGYIKNYARYLQIDEEEFAEFLEDTPEVDLVVYDTSSEEQTPSRKLLYLSLLMLVIVIFVAKLLFRSDLPKVTIDADNDQSKVEDSIN